MTEDTDSAERLRFAFGENWSRFAARLDASRIQNAVDSLRSMLELQDLNGLTFLDIGCGSGLFSLAARQLGARVVSFDYDPASVATAQRLRQATYPDDTQWRIEQGSVLDAGYLSKLGQFDIVYSWGVLHHTGSMWQALQNAAERTAPGGTLFIAIYNDQGRYSRWWYRTKWLYNWLPASLRFLVLFPCFVRLRAPMLVRDLLQGNPLRSWKEYRHRARGMSAWYDVVDWVGGFPFEVAKPEEIFDFHRARGFTLLRMKTCGGGRGCNEFVLRHAPKSGEGDAQR